MFNRDNDFTKALVQLRLTDGREVRGQLQMPYGSTPARVLNNDDKFVSIEQSGGREALFAKTVIAELSLAEEIKMPTLVNRAPGPEDGPYTVLGLASDADHETVSRTYRKMAKIYHPDNFASVHLPQEVTNYLNEAFRQIAIAYHEINRQAQSEKQMAA